MERLDELAPSTWDGHRREFFVTVVSLWRQREVVIGQCCPLSSAVRWWNVFRVLYSLARIIMVQIRELNSMRRTSMNEALTPRWCGRQIAEASVNRHHEESVSRENGSSTVNSAIQELTNLCVRA